MDFILDISYLSPVLLGIYQILKILCHKRIHRQLNMLRDNTSVPFLANIPELLNFIILLMKLICIHRRRQGFKTKINKLLPLLTGYRFTSTLKNLLLKTIPTFLNLHLKTKCLISFFRTEIHGTDMWYRLEQNWNQFLVDW